MEQGRGFLQGLMAGTTGTLVGGAALLYVFGRLELIQFDATAISDPGAWLAWAYVNLGSSIPVFAALLLAYFATMGNLRRGGGGGGAGGPGGGGGGPPLLDLNV